jgi:hypothetical protein
MVHLGINGGMHNMDVATLTIDAIDLERGFVDLPRGKTGIPRRFPLWPETVASMCGKGNRNGQIAFRKWRAISFIHSSTHTQNGTNPNEMNESERIRMK